MGVGVAAITHVVPHVFYNGSYPVGPLQPGQHGDFEVQVRHVPCYATRSQFFFSPALYARCIIRAHTHTHTHTHTQR